MEPRRRDDQAIEEAATALLSARRALSLAHCVTDGGAPLAAPTTTVSAYAASVGQQIRTATSMAGQVGGGGGGGGANALPASPYDFAHATAHYQHGSTPLYGCSSQTMGRSMQPVLPGQGGGNRGDNGSAAEDRSSIARIAHTHMMAAGSASRHVALGQQELQRPQTQQQQQQQPFMIHHQHQQYQYQQRRHQDKDNQQSQQHQYPPQQPQQPHQPQQRQQPHQPQQRQQPHQPQHQQQQYPQQTPQPQHDQRIPHQTARVHQNAQQQRADQQIRRSSHQERQRQEQVQKGRGQRVSHTESGLQHGQQQPKPTHLQQQQRWRQQREKDQRPKQPKATQKRKAKNKQRQEIDEIVARAEPQPEFVRQFASQLGQALPTSYDEVLARPNPGAVIRPGQSIVPRPYQRRPIDIDPRLRTMPGINGLFVGDANQNTRPLPSLRTMSGAGTAGKAPKAVQGTLPPSFPSVNENSSVSRAVWSYGRQDQSQGQPQAQSQEARTAELQRQNQALYRSLQQTQVQVQPRADAPLGRLFPPPNSERPILQQQQTREPSGASRLKKMCQEDLAPNVRLLPQQRHVQPRQSGQPGTSSFPRIPSFNSTMHRVQGGHSNQVSHGSQASTHHHYMPAPPHPQLKLELKFADSMWSDEDERSVVASNVSSTFQGTVSMGSSSFDTSAALQSPTALLPSLDFRSKKTSDWFYPTPTGKKATTQPTSESSMGNGSTWLGKTDADEKHVKHVDQSAANALSLLASQWESLRGSGMDTNHIDRAQVQREQTSGVVDNNPSFSVVVAKPINIKVSSKPLSSNRLRKIEKQTRRQERKESAQSGVGKQLSDSGAAQRQQLQKKQLPDALTQQGQQSRLEQSQPQGSLPHSSSAQRAIHQAGQQLPPHVRLEQLNGVPQLKKGTTSSSHASTKPLGRVGPGDREMAHKWAAQREQEALLRRAHLAMVAQQQLHKRKAEDFVSYSRPAPTVVMRSSSLTGVSSSKVEAFYQPLAPSNQAQESAALLAIVPSAAPTGDVDGAVQALAKEKVRKPRKRKALPPVSIPRLGSGLESNPDGLVDSRLTQRPRTEEHDVIDVTGADDDVNAAVDAIAPHIVVATPKQDGPPAPPAFDVSRSETETVMIFCKRDFFRYQAGLLWKKYQEIKRKRDLTLATVTGRRARYLNARYTNSKPGDGEAAVKQVAESARRSNKHASPTGVEIMSTKVPAVIEIIDGEAREPNEPDSARTSNPSESSSTEGVPPQQEVVMVSPSNSGELASPDTNTDASMTHEPEGLMPAVETAAEAIDPRGDGNGAEGGQPDPSSMPTGVGVSDEAVGGAETIDAKNDIVIIQDAGVVLREECVV